MPGVPSGRACEACREQKKRCDCAQPSCSRCTRLGLVCIGSGERKFHFVSVKCMRRKHGAPASVRKTKGASSFSLTPFPNNDQDALINAFTRMIKPSTNRRYSLSTAYGPWLHEVPQRIGNNAAMDAAIRALVSAHSDMCSRRAVSTESMVKYNQAIGSLRASLDDPVQARSIDTLGAVIVLLMCQALNGFDREHYIAHWQGAARILSARGCHDSDDRFACKLYETLRGKMLINVLLSQDFRQDASLWTNCKRDTDDFADESIMTYLSRIPEFLARGQRELGGVETDTQLRLDLYDTYSTLLSLRKELRVLSTDAQRLLVNGRPPTDAVEEASFNSQSAYNFGLALCCILNCMLRALNAGGEQVAVEAEEFANEALTLTHSFAILRPLGAAPILILLLVAWPCTSNLLKKRLIENALNDFYCDFFRGPDRKRVSMLLELLSRNLRFEDSSETAMKRLSIHD